MIFMMNESFNAARGFVGGATFFPHGVLPRRDVFQCRTRLCGWCNSYGSIPIRVTHDSFNAARGFVGGAARHLSGKRSPSNGFNAARSMICGATSRSSSMRAQRCGFNAARSIVCGATARSSACSAGRKVSMPHAALYVVQPSSSTSASIQLTCFNAARSMICGATTRTSRITLMRYCFNAARSMICGATHLGYCYTREYPQFQCRTQHDMWCNVRLLVSRIS